MTVSWLGGSGRWINGALWSSGTIPTPSDLALIAAPGTYTVTVDASVAAQSVTLDAPQATLAVQGTNSVNTALFVNGVLALQAGTLSLSSGGVLSGATVEPQGGNFVASGGALNNVTWQGILALGGGFNTLLYANGLQFTGAGGTGAGALQLYGYGANLRALDNETLDNVAISVASFASITSVGSLTFGAHVSLADAAQVSITSLGFTNGGVMDATHGSLYIYGSLRNTGMISTGTLGVFDFYGVQFSNIGQIAINSSSNLIDSNVATTATNAAGQNIQQAVPVNFINAGTLTLAAKSGLNIAGFSYVGATGGAYVTNTGLAAVNGDLELTLQNLLNSGTIAIGGGGTVDANFLAQSSFSSGASGTLSNSGVIQIAQGGTLEVGLSAAFAIASLGTINSVGGTLQLTRGALDDTGGTLAVGAVGTLTDIVLSGGAILHGGVVLAAPNTAFAVNGTLDAVTWIGPLAMPSTPSGFTILTLQDGFVLQPASGTALGALDVAAGESVTLNGATLTPAAINTDGTLFLPIDFTVDPGSVLNAASGQTLITSSSVASTGGTLTLQGVTYATAPKGTLGIGRPFKNNGTLVIGNGDVVSVGSLDGTGTVEIGVGKLSIAAGASASETIRFNGPGGTIALTAPLLSAGAMLAPVQNFGSGDTIDLGPVNADQVFFEGGNLVLTLRGTLTATVPFSTIFNGAFGASDFQLVSDGSGGVGVTTTVPGAAVTSGPAVSAADIVGTPTLSPFAGLTIGDPNASALDSVTVTSSATASGAFSNPGATGEIDGTGTYLAAGTAGALTSGLQGLVFKQAAGTASVTRTTFTISASGASGTTTATENATLVTQYGALAAAAASSLAFATSPDGASFAPPVSGKINEAVASVPGSGAVLVVPAGFQAEYAAGSANVVLADPGYGGVLLAGNSGNDILYANGNNDTLVGGSGSDTMIAIGAATIQSLATSGTALIYGGSGATSIQGPTGSAATTIIAGSGNTAITTGGLGNLVALNGGNDTVLSTRADTIFAGTGANSILATGANAVIALGTNTSTVTANGFAQTVFGGAGAATVTLLNSDLYFGGSGTGSVFSANVSTILGGTGAVTVFGGGIFKGGGNGGNFLDLSSNSAGGIAFAGGGGDTLISHGAGSFTNQLVAGSGNETLIADPGSAGTALFAGSGADQIILFGNNDTVFGGTGAATVGTAGGAYGFAFTNGQGGGAMAINGFNPASDRLVLTAFAPGTGAAAIAGATVANGSEQLALPDGTLITLVGFTGLTSASVIG